MVVKEPEKKEIVETKEDTKESSVVTTKKAESTSVKKKKGKNDTKKGKQDKKSASDKDTATATKKIKEPLPLFAERLLISNIFKHKNVTLREFSPNCHGATLIQGFPQETDVTASLATHYVVEQLKLPMIGDITSRKFPFLCVVKNAVPYNAIRIHGNDKIVCVVSDFSSIEGETVHDIVEAIIDFARRWNIKSITFLVDLMEIQTNLAGRSWM